MKLVVGSNFMAWLTAIALKKGHPKSRIALVNFGKTFGGNSQSFKFMDQFIDVGMQTFYECGVDWADDIVREALTANHVEFNDYAWPFHDPCVTWQNGKLHNTVYPVHHSDMTLNDYYSTFLDASPVRADNDNLSDSLIAHFGGTIWQDVLLPIARKFSIGDVEDLSIVSLAPIPIDRILALHISDEELLQKPQLYKRLAFSNPDNIPQENVKRRSTIYPKSGGIAAIIGALKMLAERYGIEIYENFNFESLSVKDKRLEISDFEADEIFWALSNKPLNEIIGYEAPAINATPFAGCHLGVFCESGFQVSEAHYLLSFDDDPIFRITFYGNLAGEHALCYASVELLTAPDFFDEAQITQFFKRAGLIATDATCRFSLPKYSPWPISFQTGYTKAREIEEEGLRQKLENLVILNANPSKAAIMQTPTLAYRLGSLKI